LKPEIKREAAHAALAATFEHEHEVMAQTMDGLADLINRPVSGLNRHEVRAEASYIHDFYTSCETLFKTVAIELNGGIPRGDMWHKTLLREMKAPVSGKRPAVISQKLYELLEEVLRFRHIVRNSYGILLDAKKMRRVSRIAVRARKMLVRQFPAFLATILPA